MRLFDETSCFNEITAYFNSEVSGYPFIANIDDSTILQSIISKMQADGSKTIVRVSEYCNDDGLPNVYKFKSDVKSLENGIVLGYLLNDMFLGEMELKRAISDLLHLPIKGHVVILTYGCGGILKNAIYTDGNRANHRTIILENEHFILPTITMTASNEDMTLKTVKGFSNLLNALESLSYDMNDADILVRTKVLPNIYKKSILQIKSINGIYDVLCKKYHEIKSSTEQEWGSDKQWKSLYGKIEKAGSLSSVIVKEFGSVYNLSMMIKNAFIDTESDRAWLLWIAMKVFGTKENTVTAVREIFIFKISVKLFVQKTHCNL